MFTCCFAAKFEPLDWFLKTIYVESSKQLTLARYHWTKDTRLVPKHAILIPVPALECSLIDVRRGESILSMDTFQTGSANHAVYRGQRILTAGTVAEKEIVLVCPLFLLNFHTVILEE